MLLKSTLGSVSFFKRLLPAALLTCLGASLFGVVWADMDPPLYEEYVIIHKEAGIELATFKACAIDTDNYTKAMEERAVAAGASTKQLASFKTTLHESHKTAESRIGAFHCTEKIKEEKLRYLHLMTQHHQNKAHEIKHGAPGKESHPTPEHSPEHH